MNNAEEMGLQETTDGTSVGQLLGPCASELTNPLSKQVLNLHVRRHISLVLAFGTSMSLWPNNFDAHDTQDG